MSTRDRLLEVLERHRQETLSGEDLARMLGVSRNAVWKAMKELQKEGYLISAATNRGYCFASENDILSPQGMAPYLDSGIAAEQIHVFGEVDSTNRVAKEMALANADHGTVVIADSQTAGRGRYGRSFCSPPGSGLYMSVILHPDQLRLPALSLLMPFAALAVCQVAEQFTQDRLQIKWINDVYLGGRKICGIMTEAASDFESGTVQWVVLGIGVNIYVAEQFFPEELRRTVGAVCRREERPGARNLFAAMLLNKLLAQEPGASGELLLAEYKKRSMVLGRDVEVVQGEETYPARAVDIDQAGNLVVVKEDGEAVSLGAGEIRVRLTGFS